MITNRKPYSEASTALKLLLACAMLIGVFNAEPALAGRAVKLDLAEFLQLQGSYCVDDGQGGCILFVPPYKNFIGWFAPAGDGNYYYSGIDYAGLVNQWAEEHCGISFGTEIQGTIMQYPERNGRTRVSVNLHTQNAVAWVKLNQFLGPLVFGYDVEDDVCAQGQDAALADTYLQIDYYVAAGLEPLIDLMELLGPTPAGYEPLTIFFEANGTGALHEPYFSPEGAPGHLHVTQTGTMFQTPWKGATGDGWPAELINLQVVGQ